MNNLDPELLNLYTILDVQHPVALRQSARGWVKDSLKSVGWNEGEPVPANLPEYFGAVFKHLNLPASPSSIEAALQTDAVRLTLTNAIRKIQEKLNLEQTLREQLGEDALPSPDDPEALRTIKQGMIDAQIEKIKADAQIFQEEEDLEDDDLEDDEPEEAPKQEPVHPGFCPCCHWDLSQEHDISDISEEDQRAFLIYVLGGPAFTKEFTIWNGLCTVELKTTGEREDELVTEQYAKDYQEGLLSIPLFAQQKQAQYYTVLALNRLEFHASTRVQAPPVPSIWNTKFEPVGHQTRLGRYMQEWYLEKLPSSELRRELIACWRKFRQLIIRLQQELHSPDFWNGPTSG